MKARREAFAIRCAVASKGWTYVCGDYLFDRPPWRFKEVRPIEGPLDEAKLFADKIDAREYAIDVLGFALIYFEVVAVVEQIDRTVVEA